MTYELSSDAEKRLLDYVGRIGDVLGNKKRRASFANYAVGLLGDGERKSVEPIAARACADPKMMNAIHQRLLHFIAESDWSDEEVRREATRHAISAMTEREPIETWILDDTGFLKQGSHSVGVQRQYTGSAGKITNCQVAVSLCVASRSEHLPIDFQLYLPECWLDDPARRREARIPDEVVFKTKIDMGLDLIKRALDARVPRGVLLADLAYGNSSAFRASVRCLGLHYAVAVGKESTVWRVDKFGKYRGDRIAVRELAKRTPRKKIRRVTWREGAKGPMTARFAMCRVVPCHPDQFPASEREEIWLVAEWEGRNSTATKYYFSSLPRTAIKKRLVRLIKSRWRTERAYEDLKGELGLDHFEGRLLRGWNHHVSVVLCCFAFIVAERSRSFSPSAKGTEENCPNAAAA